MHKFHHARAVICYALQKGLVNKKAVHFWLSYQYSILTTEDFAELIQHIDNEEDQRVNGPNLPLEFTQNFRPHYKFYN